MSTQSTTTDDKEKRPCTNEPISQSNPFFSLPYDILGEVYNYFDDLPPTTSGESFGGFILSCQQAKTELEEHATAVLVKQYKNFEIEFQAKAGHPIGMPTYSTTPSKGTKPSKSTFPQLRNITVTLPINVLFKKRNSTGAESEHGGFAWDIGTLLGLHVLWAGRYDMVHVKLTGDGTEVFQLTAMKLSRYICLAMTDIQKVVRILNDPDQRKLYVTKRDKPWETLTTPVTDAEWSDPGNRVTALHKSMAKREIENHGDAANYSWPWYGKEPPPIEPIRTKRICFSWTLPGYDSTQPPTPLSGRVHWPGERRRQRFPDFQYLPIEKSSLFYHVYDEKRTVAEAGIVTQSRWNVIDGFDNLILLLPEGYYRRGDDVDDPLFSHSDPTLDFAACSSDRLGGQISFEGPVAMTLGLPLEPKPEPSKAATEEEGAGHS